MSGQPSPEVSADIVNLVGFLDRSKRRKVVQPVESRESASLLSIRQSLVCQATVGIDNMELIKHRTSSADFDQLNAALRRLLDREFGHLRIHRHRQVFTVGHHCMEKLIAGLLRVQFFARQLVLPYAAFSNADDESTGVSISWGVGESISEAEIERLKRFAQKRS